MSASTQDRDAWLANWLDAVRDCSAAMSQRVRPSIDRNGGLDAAVAAARPGASIWWN